MVAASSLFRRVVGVAGKGFLGATAVSSAATLYVYKTDESWKRCIDFHVLITPLCWNYYLAYHNTESGSSERKRQLDALHKQHAPELLGHVLSLGGYYVKCAQMFCGMGMLPAAYEDSFSCLLDGVPAKDFATVKEIVEAELGGNLTDFFEAFDEKALAAASIGQVHCARLKKPSQSDGVTDVVVKVQYPEVERFFHLDVLSMQNLCKLCQSCGIDVGMDAENLDRFWDEMTKSFAEEFDYRLESGNMALVRRNLLEGGGKSFNKGEIKIPVAVGELTTRKVLTMERLRGEPIKRRMKRMMVEMAEKEGKTVEEFETEMKRKYEDPKEMQKLLMQRPLSAAEIWLYKAWLRMGDVVRNSWCFVRSWLTSSKPAEYRWSTLPLNTSRIIPLIFAVHAQQLFVDGAFNADPHAGNILVCEGNAIGFIDFGNVQRVPDVQRRKQLANFYLSMAHDVSSNPRTWNDDAIAKNFSATIGGSTKNNTRFLAANALMTYDMRLDAATLARFGFKEDMSDLTDLVSREDFGGDTFKEFPADMINVQRLCQTLVGVAGAVGAGQPSPAAMWRRQCEEVAGSRQ